LASRQLIRNLTVKELKVRYKRSALGFLWSLLNPLLMMGVFTLVFRYAFRVPIEDFHLFFLVGYLPWAFFQASVNVATGSIVANANLVTKVYFPREVLPISVILSQLVHFALAMALLLVILPFLGYFYFPYLGGFLIAVVLLVLFTTGLSMFFAAANTTFRDIAEFSPVLFLLWFYLTPVIYSLDLLPTRIASIIALNPMTHFMRLFRDSLYTLQHPEPATLLIAAGWAGASLLFGSWIFARRAADFAKEI
jgi:ABC-2 type transport system permease protein